MKAFKKLQTLPVATAAEGALVGKLDDFQFDLDAGNIYGFRLTKGVFSKAGGVAAAAVTLLGRDLVFLRAEADVEWAGAPRVAVEGRAWASEYRGMGVMTRRGTGVGTVEDLVVGLGPARVTALLLDAGRVVVIDEHVALGRAAVILADPGQAVARPEGDEESADWWRRVKGLFESER
jgi:sporulation protein YlmC with PRC-barrel domain